MSSSRLNSSDSSTDSCWPEAANCASSVVQARRAARRRGHVAHRAGATDADRLVEIELAVLQLADAGQALAERVEAVGLGLQFAQARGQGIDLALRLAARGGRAAACCAGPAARAARRCRAKPRAAAGQEADAAAARPITSAGRASAERAERSRRVARERLRRAEFVYDECDGHHVRCLISSVRASARAAHPLRRPRWMRCLPTPRWRSRAPCPVARRAGPSVASPPAAFAGRACAAGQLRSRQARVSSSMPRCGGPNCGSPHRNCSTRPDPSGSMRPSWSSKRPSPSAGPPAAPGESAGQTDVGGCTRSPAGRLGVPDSPTLGR